MSTSDAGPAPRAPAPETDSPTPQAPPPWDEWNWSEDPAPRSAPAQVLPDAPPISWLAETDGHGAPIRRASGAQSGQLPSPPRDPYLSAPASDWENSTPPASRPLPPRSVGEPDAIGEPDAVGDPGPGSGWGEGLRAPEATSALPVADPAWQVPMPAQPGLAGAYATGQGKGPGWAAVVGIAGVTGLIAALAGAGLGASLAGRDLLGSRSDAISRPADSFAALAARSLPSVVTIRATGSDGNGATGSGFVYDEAGHVITNNHVVEGVGEKITVVLADGTTVPAQIVGTDPAYDIAVLATKKSGLRPLPMAGTPAVVGDLVLAMGAPLGLESTVTSGIVSALNRPVVAGGSGSRSYINAIQTDAAINPGNSGGPLIDMSGKVIGVNSAIATPPGSSSASAGNIGLGFAIPSAQVVKTADQLIKTGSSEHPVIGVMLDTAYSGPGARVRASGENAVTPGGPADRAGIEPGDLIVSFDGRTVQGPDDLIVAIRAKSVGDTVAMTVRRDGRSVDVTMTLQAAPNK